jgi:hypothetical protein
MMRSKHEHGVGIAMARKYIKPVPIIVRTSIGLMIFMKTSMAFSIIVNC